MKCEAEIPPELLNETQAARYIGKFPEFLRRRRTDMQLKHRPPGPPFIHAPGSQAVLYRTEDLNSWLWCHQPAREAAEKQYECACRLGQVPNKTFCDLLVDLESWLGTHRPDFWESFFDPASKDQLDQFEESTGLTLPRDYRLLMSWRDGHHDPNYNVLDPFEQKGLLPLGITKSVIVDMNRLLHKASFDEEYWRRDWLPFMDDDCGGYLCIDLSARHYGKVFYWDNKGAFRTDVSNNLASWLEELVGKLQFLDVQLWERENMV